MDKIHDAVKVYLDRGWHPIRVKEFNKYPRDTNWQTNEPNPENFMSTQNVGIVLGDACNTAVTPHNIKQGVPDPLFDHEAINLNLSADGHAE